MRKRFLTLLTCIFALLGFFPSAILAGSPIEDGVYYISNTTVEGYLGLGAYHEADPYIYYVTDGQPRTADGYWLITNTRSGYTFRNEASGEYLVFTTNRVDRYYKYMTRRSTGTSCRARTAHTAYRVQPILNTTGTFGAEPT